MLSHTPSIALLRMLRQLNADCSRAAHTARAWQGRDGNRADASNSRLRRQLHTTPSQTQNAPCQRLQRFTTATVAPCQIERGCRIHTNAAAAPCRTISTWHRATDLAAPHRPSTIAITPRQSTTAVTRQASTITAVTAVGGRPSIPAAFRKLYNALIELGDVGAIYVDAPSLRLALRSLESTESTLRVAVLGLDDLGTARQLAATLLADPLSDAEEWEAQLRSQDERSSLLIKNGERTSLQQSSQLFRTLTAPIHLLDRYNVELLVIGHSPQTSNAASAEAMAMFGKTLPNDIQPVHKILVCGRGIEAVQRLSAAFLSDTHGRSLRLGLLDGPWDAREMGAGTDKDFHLVNIDLGSQAIEAIRQNPPNGTVYEHAWLSSGLQPAMAFLQDDARLRSGLRVTIRAYIRQVLQSTEAAVASDASLDQQERVAETMPEATRTSLQMAIANWSEDAHLELQEKLERACHGRPWRRLAWWKLLWRVDDVGMVISDTLQRAYLIDAEKNMILVTGRINQACQLGLEGDRPKPMEQVAKTRSVMDPIPPLSTNDPVVQPEHPKSDEDELQSQLDSSKQQPWPQQIALSRASILTTTAGPLQREAQVELLSALTTTAMTSAFAALTYLSFASIGIFEAGAFAALGAAWSARRLQQRWEGARRAWATGVREEGRLVLRRVESILRTTVKSQARPRVDPVKVQARRQTKATIDHVRKLLEQMS